MLDIVAAAHTLAELLDQQAEAAAVLAERIAELERGEVSLTDLLITQMLSRAPQDYAVATRTALAAQQLIDEGIPVHPGETVGYVIADAKARDRERRVTTSQENGKAAYDVTEYARLLRAAGEEICDPLQKNKVISSSNELTPVADALPPTSLMASSGIKLFFRQLAHFCVIVLLSSPLLAIYRGVCSKHPLGFCSFRVCRVARQQPSAAV